MSRAIYLGILICIFSLAIAIPAMAITTGPLDDASPTCESWLNDRGLNSAIHADLEVLYNSPQYGAELKAAHDLISNALNRRTRVNLVAIQFSFDASFSYDQFIVSKAQDLRMGLVAHLGSRIFPEIDSPVKTGAELTVISPNFDRLLLTELLNDSEGFSIIDDLKRVVESESLKVPAELEGLSKRPVLISIDARQVPLIKDFSFVSLARNGEIRIYDKLIDRLEAIASQWAKEGIPAFFVLRGQLEVEPARGRRTYMPSPVGGQIARIPNQYWTAGGIHFPRQVMINSRPGISSAVILAPNPYR